AAVDNSNSYFAALNTSKLSKEKVLQAKDQLRDANAALQTATKEKQDADQIVLDGKDEIAKLTKELPQAKEKAAHTAEASKKDPKNNDLSKAAAQAAKSLSTLEQTLENAKLNETKVFDAAKVAADSLKIATANAANAKTDLANAESQAENDQKEVET
ncbi:hypothetical protein D0809_25710, partial [Flavobacterium circumlabens]